MARSIERRAENKMPMVTVTPYPIEEQWNEMGT